jgi:uncharacterized protein (TIGR00661 family)
MRIVYGVFGYGRGHTTRALAVLPQLERRHEVLLLAGGMAYDMLSQKREVFRIPTLSYRYNEAGRMAVAKTLHHNLGYAADVLFGGDSMRTVVERVRDFAPDVAICDVDPWTHRAADRLGVPRISFDHYGILAYCRPPIPLRDRLRHARDVLAYRLLTGRPQRIVVSSFYDAPAAFSGVRRIGPLLRDEVYQVRPRQGDHLVAYFNQPALFTARVEESLAALGVPVLVYGTERTGSDGRLSFRAPADRDFLADLASCRAVVGTAGNQLVGEALHFGKPVFVMPEGTVEQRVNAAAVERAGIGMQLPHDRLTPDLLRMFVARETIFLGNMRRRGARDGRVEALAALEGFAAEVARGDRRPARDWRYAA